MKLRTTDPGNQNSFGAGPTLHGQVLSIVQGPVNTKLNIRELHLGEGRGKGPLDMHADVQKWNVLNFTKSKVNFQKSIQKKV